jgi:hypothetical protein
MPNLNEGTLLYMPTTLPGLSITKSPSCCRPRTRSSRRSPRWKRVRQGRPRRDGDRPGADRNVRDRDQPEAQGSVAAGHDVDKLIAEMDKALQFPGVRTPGPCRSRPASTCWRPASARRRRQGDRPDLKEIETARARDRGGGQDRARHVERLRRAGHRRLLPRHRARPHASSPATA